MKGHSPWIRDNRFWFSPAVHRKTRKNDFPSSIIVMIDIKKIVIKSFLHIFPFFSLNLIWACSFHTWSFTRKWFSINFSLCPSPFSNTPLRKNSLSWNKYFSTFYISPYSLLISNNLTLLNKSKSHNKKSLWFWEMINKI